MPNGDTLDDMLKAMGIAGETAPSAGALARMGIPSRGVQGGAGRALGRVLPMGANVGRAARPVAGWSGPVGWGLLALMGIVEGIQWLGGPKRNRVFAKTFGDLVSGPGSLDEFAMMGRMEDEAAFLRSLARGAENRAPPMPPGLEFLGTESAASLRAAATEHRKSLADALAENGFVP